MFLTPFQAARLAQETGMMLAEAQMVIAMRMFGMAGLVPMSPREPTRMVQEKAEAMMQASKAASRAMMSGGGAASVAMAVKVWTPSASATVGVKLHAPPATAVVVPSTFVPS